MIEHFGSFEVIPNKHPIAKREAPKKIGMDAPYTMWYSCPGCGDENISRYYQFCPDCGIKLLWEEEK